VMNDASIGMLYMKPRRNIATMKIQLRLHKRKCVLDTRFVEFEASLTVSMSDDKVSFFESASRHQRQPKELASEMFIRRSDNLGCTHVGWHHHAAILKGSRPDSSPV
jgi:hypothetical protein